MQTLRKLPTARPRKHESDDQTVVEAHVAPLAFGIGKAPTAVETLTVPVAGSIAKGVPAGSTRNATEPSASDQTIPRNMAGPAGGGFADDDRAAAHRSSRARRAARGPRRASGAARLLLTSGSAAAGSAPRRGPRPRSASSRRRARASWARPAATRRAGTSAPPPHVAELPVIDEARCRGSTATSSAARDALAQERDRLIRPAAAAGICLAQEYRAEPVRDREVRIERRREIEQRIQQFVLARLFTVRGDRRRNAGWRGSSRRRPASASNASAMRRERLRRPDVEDRPLLCCRLADTGDRARSEARSPPPGDERRRHAERDDAVR